MFSSLPTTLVKAFAALGAVLVTPFVYRFVTFVWIYFLRTSSVHKYLTGLAPYALITGSTDGIGKALAKELYRRGFNLIIHGRNESKTRKVVEELKATSDSNRDIRYFIADAAVAGHDFRKILEEFEDLNITILINNVGGTTLERARIDEWTDESIYGTLRRSALFGLGVTRALLPQLRRSPGPALIISVGSYAGDTPPPRLVMYSVSKRLVEALNRALEIDERYFTPTNIRCMYLSVNQVATKVLKTESNFFRPDADTFARAVIDRIGCGRRRVAPYIGHAVTQWVMGVLGERVAESINAKVVRRMFFADRTQDKAD